MSGSELSFLIVYRSVLTLSFSHVFSRIQAEF